MNITITFPDAIRDRVIDGVAGANGYLATIGLTPEGTPIPNPETKAVFAKKKLIE